MHWCLSHPLPACSVLRVDSALDQCIVQAQTDIDISVRDVHSKSTCLSFCNTPCKSSTMVLHYTAWLAYPLTTFGLLFSRPYLIPSMPYCMTAWRTLDLPQWVLEESPIHYSLLMSLDNFNQAFSPISRLHPLNNILQEHKDPLREKLVLAKLLHIQQTLKEYKMLLCNYLS